MVLSVFYEFLTYIYFFLLFGRIACFSASFNCFEAFWVNIWLNKMFLIERNLFGILVTTITSKRFLVKFDSFQRPLPTFSFVAVSPNCLFLSKFQVLLSVLVQVS